MVSSQESETGPTVTNGVVGSFYDFFAKLYSSSFTANPPWATVQGGASAAPTDHLGTLQPAAPWADGLEYPPATPAVNGMNGRQEDRRRHQEARHQEADFHPYKDHKGAERGRKPHRLEFGWPEDDAGNLKVHMRTPKVSGNGRSRESLRAPKPEGFPEPTDLPQNLSSRGLREQREQREQKQREMKEQRDQAARQQEEWLRRQQSELKEQREQYLQEQEAKFEERLPSKDQRDRRDRAIERSDQHERGDRERKDNNYKADPEDLIDQHVAYFLRKNPEVKGRHKIERTRPNTYLLDNREVQIEWQYATEPGGQGFLVVVDGPLRQPFSDYMRDTEENATYDGLDIVQSNLHGIRRDLRMSFNDSMKVYNRLEAMKVAKEQALFREKAAALTKEGIEVPQDELAEKYRKIIDMKLGHGRTKGLRPRNEEPPPSPEPPVTQPPSPQPVAHQPAAAPAAPAAPAAAVPPPPYAPPASPAPHTPARLSAASPAPVGRMHSGQAQLIGYGSYCPSPKPSARAVEGVQGGSTPGLPVPSPIPMRQQWTPSNPVLLGAGTPTSITTQPYKTQLPQTWQRVHHTPRTPSGGIVGMDLPQLDPKKATAGAPLGLAPNPFEEPNIFADRYAPSLYNREVKLFPSAPGRPRLHYDY